MFDIRNPGTPPGGFSMTAAQSPIGDPNQVMQNALSGNPMMDWRMARPDRGAFSAPMDWKNALMGWRAQKPGRGDVGGGVNPQQGLPTPQPQIPINGQLPLNPYGSFGG